LNDPNRDRQSFFDRLRELRMTESDYAHSLARLYRETHPNGPDLPKPDLPPNRPLQQLLLDRRLHLHQGRTQYDDTYHHRDFVALKSAEPSDGRAIDAAIRKSLETARRIEENYEKAAKSQAAARQRYHHAMHDIQMEAASWNYYSFFLSLNV
jgi:hypothetical protein